ncbi:hypothetical protein ACQVPP_15660 [Bacillus luti]|uniref:hypothetical protein n=1 Tax=Bacillus luti TaxID=2026191 RepID=UPI003D658532
MSNTYAKDPGPGGGYTKDPGGRKSMYDPNPGGGYIKDPGTLGYTQDPGGM